MGAFCCCPCSDEVDEYAYSSNSVYSHCICLRFFVHQLLNGYGAMFHRIDGRTMSGTQVGTSLVPTGVGLGSPDDSLSDSHGTVSRPAPFDSDQRYTRLQRDGLVSRKSTNHFQEESLPLRRNISSSSVESLGFGKKRNSEDNSKISHSESSEKALAAKLKYGLAYVQTLSEDEDVCPTCLEEYTNENPKITTRCSHHFHLGCIYEWLERSESCPICGKEMEFCESP